MVRCKRFVCSITCQSKCVQIPPWFDANSCTSYIPCSPSNVQIPPWFDANASGCAKSSSNKQSSNSTVVRCKPRSTDRSAIALTVQIPPWFDANARYLLRFSRVSTFECLKNFCRSPVPLKSWEIDGTKQRLCCVLDHLDLIFPRGSTEQSNGSAHPENTPPHCNFCQRIQSEFDPAVQENLLPHLLTVSF